MKISLIICTYNRIQSLPTTLQSIEFLRYPDLEVIVVDGPSEDGTASYLKANWEDKVKIYKCDEANLSKSRNIGIVNAAGDIVCFIDDDGIPEPDWLDHIARAYENEKVAAVGGWVRNHTGVEFQTKYILSCRDGTSDVLLEDLKCIPDSKPFTHNFPGLIGVNSSFRKEALLEVGGFDEEYLYFLDETDVVVRLLDAGYHVRQISNAEVHHKYAPSHIRSESGTARSWLQIIKSTAYFVIKNSSPETDFTWCLNTIRWHKNNLKSHTNWYLSQNLIDETRYNELIGEIEKGAEKGIVHAFAYPLRKLISNTSPPVWKNFSRLLSYNNRLKLVFVTALYPPQPCGGIAVFINNLAIRLAEIGHEVTVITRAEHPRIHTVDFEDGVWVHRLPDDDSVALELPSTIPDMPEQAKNWAGKVLAEINRVNDIRSFDLVVGTIWDLDLAAVIASEKYRTAIYLVTSYKLMEDSKPEWKENITYYNQHIKKMVRAEGWALENADQIISSNEIIVRDIEFTYDKKLDKKRLNIIPFGVPEPLLNYTTRKIVSDKLVLLFVGRFEYRKGIDLLLNCLPSLMKKYSHLVVNCIGDYNLREHDGTSYKESFIEANNNEEWIDRIRFKGHVDNYILEEEYANCDIFVAPSRYESFGLIYLEAMRYGKPCIGTQAGGIQDVIIDGKTGVLIPPGDSSSLKIAIEKLIENEDLRLRMGENGRKAFLQNYTNNLFASRFEESARRWIQS